MARVPCTRTHDDGQNGQLCRCECGYVGGLNIMVIDARIPKTSQLVAQVVGTVRGNGGGRVRVALWDAFTSHGYHTNYASVRTRIVEISRSWKANSWTNAREVTRFTGRRFDKAEELYKALEAQVAPDMAVSA